MSKFLPWLINLAANSMCLFLIWLWVASAWAIGSSLSSSFCQKTFDKHLGRLELSLRPCVSLSRHFQEHFSILHFGTISRLFNSSLTVLRADPWWDGPAAPPLWALDPGHCWSVIPVPPAPLAWLLSKFRSAQNEGEWWWINPSSFGWGPRSHPNQPSERAIHGCYGHKPSWSSALEPLCRCCNKCGCVNVCVGRVTPSCVWIIHTHTPPSFFLHIYGKIAICGKSRLKSSSISWNRS